MLYQIQQRIRSHYLSLNVKLNAKYKHTGKS